MTKYNFHDYKRYSPERMAIIRATLPLKIDASAVDITLAIDGAEVDFMEFVSRYVAQINSLAERKARAIIEEKLSKTRDMLDGIEEYVEAELDTMDWSSING